MNLKLKIFFMKLTMSVLLRVTCVCFVWQFSRSAEVYPILYQEKIPTSTTGNEFEVLTIRYKDNLAHKVIYEAGNLREKYEHLSTLSFTDFEFQIILNAVNTLRQNFDVHIYKLDSLVFDPNFTFTIETFQQHFECNKDDFNDYNRCLFTGSETLCEIIGQKIDSITSLFERANLMRTWDIIVLTPPVGTL